MSDTNADPVADGRAGNRADRRRFAVAISCAFIVELAGAGIFLARPDHRPPMVFEKPRVMQVSIRAPLAPTPAPLTPPMPPVPPVPPQPVPPLPVPPLPVAPTRSVASAVAPAPTAPVASHMRRSRPRPRDVSRRAPLAPEAVRQAPATTPATVAVPVDRPSASAPASAPAAPSAGVTASFEAALRLAVQASLIYPSGAQAAHEKGVAHLRFDYQDGVVSDVTLISSTGFPILDDAAARTVRAARYPETPKAFSGRRLMLDVLVVFRAGESDMESD